MVLGFNDILPDNTVTDNGFSVRNGTQLIKYTGSADNITVPQGISEICENAFAKNRTLVRVKLPESTEFIHRSAFAGCTALKSVSVPESLIGIGSRAFAECSSLTELRAYRCSEKTIGRARARASVFGSRISAEAFVNCRSLKYADIPHFVHIENEAFAGCASLESIALPESLFSLGSGTFRGCTSLRSINIPQSTVKLGSSVFEGCTALRMIDVSESNPVYVSAAGMLCARRSAVYDGGGSDVLTVPEGKQGAFVLPAEICAAAPYSFRGCRELTSLVLPEGMKQIGEGAFTGCSGLSEITICSGQLRNIGKNAFSGCDNALVHFTDSSGNRRFSLDLRADRDLQCIPWNPIELRYPQVVFRKINSRAAKTAIVMSCLMYGAATPAEEDYYRRYIFTYADAAVEYAAERNDISLLEICAECGVFSRKRLAGYIEYCAAHGKIECTAYLMQYKKERFSEDASAPETDSDAVAVDLDLDLGELEI